MLMKARELESKQKETFSVHFSMLEIYQEKVSLLISPKIINKLINFVLTICCCKGFNFPWLGIPMLCLITFRCTT